MTTAAAERCLDSAIFLVCSIQVHSLGRLLVDWARSGCCYALYKINVLNSFCIKIWDRPDSFNTFRSKYALLWQLAKIIS